MNIEYQIALTSFILAGLSVFLDYVFFNAWESHWLRIVLGSFTLWGIIVAALSTIVGVWSG